MWYESCSPPKLCTSPPKAMVQATLYRIFKYLLWLQPCALTILRCFQDYGLGYRMELPVCPPHSYHMGSAYSSQAPKAVRALVLAIHSWADLSSELLASTPEKPHLKRRASNALSVFTGLQVLEQQEKKNKSQWLTGDFQDFRHPLSYCNGFMKQSLFPKTQPLPPAPLFPGKGLQGNLC